MAVHRRYSDALIAGSSASRAGLRKGSPEQLLANAKYLRERLQWHRGQVIEHISGGWCERCGPVEDQSMLCYHHRNPMRKAMHSRATVDQPMKLQKITPEKLEKWKREGHILCCNCHAYIHYTNDPRYLQLDNDDEGTPLDNDFPNAELRRADEGLAGVAGAAQGLREVAPAGDEADG